MAKRRSKYIHLLDGRPGIFQAGVVVFAKAGTKLEDLLVDDLDTIRQQQVQSKESAEARGFTDDFEYSHLRVGVQS